MIGQVGSNLAYLILRIIPGLLYIQCELSSVERVSLSCVGWDTISPEFEEFVPYKDIHCPVNVLISGISVKIRSQSYWSFRNARPK